jgi:rubrerythrin
MKRARIKDPAWRKEMKRLFDTPASGEHKRQSKKVADQWCRHLSKELSTVKHFDYSADQIVEEDIWVCAKCGKPISEIEIKD